MEVIIGLAVVAVLFGLAYPAYNRYVAKSQISAAMRRAGALKPGLVEYIASGGPCQALIDHVERAGLIDGVNFDGRYVMRVNIGQRCAIKAYLKTSGAIAGPLAGKIVTLQPGYRTDAGFLPLAGPRTAGIDPKPLTWRCTSNVEGQYLPVACTHRAPP